MQERTIWMEKANSTYYKGSPTSPRKCSAILRKPISLIITIITTHIRKISPKGFWRTANLDLCGYCLVTPACSDTTTHHSNTSFFVTPEFNGKNENFCFQILANWSILWRPSGKLDQQKEAKMRRTTLVKNRLWWNWTRGNGIRTGFSVQQSNTSQHHTIFPVLKKHYDRSSRSWN